MKLNSVRVTRTRAHVLICMTMEPFTRGRPLNGLLVRSQQLFSHEAGSLIPAVCLAGCDTNNLKPVLYFLCVHESADGALQVLL